MISETVSLDREKKFDRHCLLRGNDASEGDENEVCSLLHSQWHGLATFIQSNIKK